MTCTDVGIHFNRDTSNPVRLKSHAVWVAYSDGDERALTSISFEHEAKIYGCPADFRRLAAACIEAAEKGEALEREHAPQAAE